MTSFASESVARIFAAYPTGVRQKLAGLRELIFATAKNTPGVGALEETLKWNQPSYLTTETKSGSTIRLDAISAQPGRYAIYFNCQTTLVENFRQQFGHQFCYEGNRALLFDTTDSLPEKPLARCIAAALTYHWGKRANPSPSGD